MITKTDLNWWLDLEPELDWQFATTYAEGAPHEYVTSQRTPGLEPADFVRAGHVIRTFGQPLKFFKWTRIYLTTPMGWKHWTMSDDLSETNLVNRGRVEHVYGTQNAPRTASEAESPWDAFATSFDQTHAMTEEESTQTAELIRAMFGDRLWRTLDIGCGTGWLTDAGLVEPVRYVGVDPSTAMLNTLVSKHPVLAAVHPMSFGEALARRVLGGTIFDTVLALGGSASYLTPSELAAARVRGKRGALFMHYAPGEVPVTGDLGPWAAAESFAAVTKMAASQHRVGRFIASVVSAGRGE